MKDKSRELGKEDFEKQKKNLAKQFKWNDGTVYNPSSERIFDIVSDVFVPAFQEGEINEKNAKRVAKSKKIIVEGANGPTTSEAEKILEGEGRVIFPDILANAGGATVSYFEWAQNLKNKQWPGIMVEQLLNAMISEGTVRVIKTAQKYGVSYRMAANIISLMSVVDAEIARDGGKGWRSKYSEAHPPYAGYSESKRPVTIEELRLLVERSRQKGGKLYLQFANQQNKLLQENIDAVVKEITRLKQSGEKDIRWVLVGGPPTTGKTFIARGIAHGLRQAKYAAEYIY